MNNLKYMCAISIDDTLYINMNVLAFKVSLEINNSKSAPICKDKSQLRLQNSHTHSLQVYLASSAIYAALL